LCVFHCTSSSYLILALDADTFELESGRTNFEVAQNIANVAQQRSGSKGWSQMMVIKIGFFN
jgi:hypothetical protein